MTNKITYEKFEDHYIFSHEPNTRVYLGNISPEDYIWDQEQQALRTASCKYINKITGKPAEEPKCNLEDDSEYDWKFYDNHKFECTYEFKQRAHCAYMGGPKRSVKHASGDKAMERLAWIYYMDETPEVYDARQKSYRLDAEKRKKENPMMHNLMWVSGELYHVNDAGERITFDEHIALMKEQLGEDCFEKLNNKTIF
jgi:hypothetical protein